MKLHLGAFDQSIDGWINTDITPHIWIARIPCLPFVLWKTGFMTRERYEQHKARIFNRLKYLDLCKPLPFQDGSLDAVFSSHVFEHLFLADVESLIKEIHRVLKPGGVCRVVVPDLEKTVGQFSREDPRRFLTEMYEISEGGRFKNTHHSGYTGPFLVKLFTDAGFSSALVLSYRAGVCPDLEKLDNRPDSLFVEAIR